MSEPLVTPPWVDVVFDRDYLDAYQPQLGPELSRQQALGAARLAGLEPGAQILDTPCGFGRHALVLAAAGYRVTGADRSRVQLDEARLRAAGADWPQLVEADYRELPFADDTFDGVFNLFTSIGYLGDVEDTRALTEWRRVLRPGGKLVIETLHRDRQIALFSPTNWDEVPAGWLLQEHVFDPVAGTISTTHTLVRRDGTARMRAFRMRMYSATELVAMVRAAGFAEPTCYGDLEGSRFLGAGSRLVLVATS